MSAHGAAQPDRGLFQELGEREMRLLKASVELETLSDLHAAAGDLRAATEAMRQANSARRCVFGKLDPNELRERTHAVVASGGEAPNPHRLYPSKEGKND